MYTTDGWPDASEYPYRALIRIRYAHELDVLLIRQLQRAVRTVAPAKQTERFHAVTTRLAFDQLNADRVDVGLDTIGAAFRAFDPDGPICPDTPYEARLRLILELIRHGKIPVPDPDPDPVYFTAELAQVVLAAREAVSSVASKAVAEQLNLALDELASVAFDLVGAS